MTISAGRVREIVVDATENALNQARFVIANREVESRLQDHGNDILRCDLLPDERVEPTCGSSLSHAAIHHCTNHLLSTFWCQAGILMGVHSALRESLRFGDISVPGQDRMDNLLKVHS